MSIRRRFLNDASNLKELAERLSKCKSVTKFDTDKEKEAWTLTHAFSDLEESFYNFLEKQLPRLLQKDLNEKEITNLLLEIGEEFRHILYHIKDARFYCYL